MKTRLIAAGILALAGTSMACATEVRIGVFGLFHPKDIVLQTVPGHSLECGVENERWPVRGRFELAIGAPDKSESRPAPSDAPLKVLTCDDGLGGETGFIVAIPGKISRRYRGKVEFIRSRGEFVVVVIMDLETAVASVVAAESPPGAPLQALKAQAVAARSFLVAGKGRHKEFDFCDTTHCQFLRQPPARQLAAYQAAWQTRGLVLTYREAPFAAMYSASCGGRTHTLDELGLPVRDYPYFAVTCQYCRRHPQRWVAELKQADAAALSAGEPARLKLARRLGWKTVPSNSYSTRPGEAGEVVVQGVGLGHGLGLCQRGAADMAKKGASFLQILEHYYPNTAVKGLP